MITTNSKYCIRSQPFLNFSFIMISKHFKWSHKWIIHINAEVFALIDMQMRQTVFIVVEFSLNLGDEKSTLCRVLKGQCMIYASFRIMVKAVWRECNRRILCSVWRHVYFGVKAFGELIVIGLFSSYLSSVQCCSPAIKLVTV